MLLAKWSFRGIKSFSPVGTPYIYVVSQRLGVSFQLATYLALEFSLHNHWSTGTAESKTQRGK